MLIETNKMKFKMSGDKGKEKKRDDGLRVEKTGFRNE
jgi:hypothetical protein